MGETVQIKIPVVDQQIREQIIAQLSIEGFDAFEESDHDLLCFIDSKKYTPSLIQNILSNYSLNYAETIVEEQNWNALWESNFQPVEVGDFCAIRADFHQPFSDKQHEIIITPKMSFGTGHHATTYMMISEMSRLDFKGKQVADFGTGTGVLAILAEKLGSASVLAIDIDDWSIENATENIEKNSCKKIRIEKADSFCVDKSFDIILANINKNVILSNLDSLLSRTNSGGKILISGLLKEDGNEVIAAFTSRGAIYSSTIEKNNWLCILMHSPG